MPFSSQCNASSSRLIWVSFSSPSTEEVVVALDQSEGMVDDRAVRGGLLSTSLVLPRMRFWGIE